MTRQRPSLVKAVAQKIFLAAAELFNRRRILDVLDRLLVAAGWFPEKIDGSKMVLHISDTPSCCYSFVRRTLRRINPSVVVHTGDVADDVKLEMYPGMAAQYRAHAARLLAILEAPRRRVIITVGNHDDAATLSSLSVKAEIVASELEFSAGTLAFAAGHYYDSVAASGADYILYGHKPIPESGVSESGKFLLNGINAMHLIDTQSGDVTEIKYPSGTDEARLMQQSRKRA